MLSVLGRRETDLVDSLAHIAHFHPPVSPTPGHLVTAPADHGAAPPSAQGLPDHLHAHAHENAGNATYTHPGHGVVHGHADHDHGLGPGEVGDATRITAPVTLVIAGLVMLFTVAVVLRTVWVMCKDEVVKGRRVRRLRGMLVVSLLAADFVIASIGPAAMIFRNLSLSGYQCGPSGLTLALGLWWQYLSSLLVGLVTFLSLRHPLSALLRRLKSHPSLLLLLIFALGLIPAGLWFGLHGYSGCHGFCFYGLPSDAGAEVMQFLPRLLVSGAIIALYVPVIGFLQRPDMGGAYLPSSPDPGRGRARSRSRSRSRSATPEEEEKEAMPPWERLSFPNFQFAEDEYSFPPYTAGGGSVAGRGGKEDGSMSVRMSPATTLRTFASTKGLLAGASPSSTLGRKGQVDHEAKDRTALPAPHCTRARSSTIGSDLLTVTFHDLPRPPPPARGHTRSETLPSAAHLVEAQSQSPSPRVAGSTFTPPPAQSKPRLPGRARPHTSTGASPGRLSRVGQTGTNAGVGLGLDGLGGIGSLGDGAAPDGGPRVSFHAMLALAPEPPRSRARAASRSVSGRSRASTLVDRDRGLIPGLGGGDVKGFSVDGEKGLGFDLREAMMAGRNRAASFDTQATAVEVPESKAGAEGGAERRGSQGTLQVSIHEAGAGQMTETMDSFMRRRTRLYLLWFPLTHLVLIAFTIARFAYFAISKHDSHVVDFLTLVVIMGQGMADVVIFGLVEYRTKERYRREVDSCQLSSRQSSLEEGDDEELGEVELEVPVQRAP